MVLRSFGASSRADGRRGMLGKSCDLRSTLKRDRRMAPLVLPADQCNSKVDESAKQLLKFSVQGWVESLLTGVAAGDLLVKQVAIRTPFPEVLVGRSRGWQLGAASVINACLRPTLRMVIQLWFLAPVISAAGAGY
ncbi:hypothetical protein KC19_VG068500 [Ceratodon purpureus]|uniref:Uncharacterized protein n=1 Tax=Ceratodon purpureus TaxID=3225 RepID=A0A8T0HMQ6_CERPU|nr:hypothetical protein KC19_VG068500 [Ceratodon purpureus]